MFGVVLWLLWIVDWLQVCGVCCGCCLLRVGCLCVSVFVVCCASYGFAWCVGCCLLVVVLLDVGCLMKAGGRLFVSCVFDKYAVCGVWACVGCR